MILDEVDRNIAQDYGISPAKLQRRRALMNGAIRDCLVTGFEPLIEGLKLSDPDDRHVLAAAIQAGAYCRTTPAVGTGLYATVRMTVPAGF